MFHFFGGKRKKINAPDFKALLAGCVRHISPEKKVIEKHAPYDRHHKVSSFLKGHQNTHNSVKYEVI